MPVVLGFPFSSLWMQLALHPYLPIHFGIRFSLIENTICLEHEIYNLNMSLLSVTLRENSKVVWELGPSKFRVYGLPDSQLGVSTDLLSPLRSSTCTLGTPPIIKLSPVCTMSSICLNFSMSLHPLNLIPVSKCLLCHNIPHV